MGNVILMKDRYSNQQDVINLIYYITYPAKCGYIPLCGTNNIFSINPLQSRESVISQFLTIQDAYPGTYKRRVYHIVYSLDNALDDTRLQVIYSIGLAFTWLYPNYQSIFTVHEDTKNLHLHMIINNIPIIGKKTLSSYINILNLDTVANLILEEYRYQMPGHNRKRINPYNMALNGLERFRSGCYNEMNNKNCM